LAQGATHILLWLSALTAETGNDWGDGLRILTEGAVEPTPIADPTAEEPVVAGADEETVIDEPAVDPAADPPANRENRGDRENRQNRQNQQNRENRQNRDNRQSGDDAAGQ
jgi:hypothetical protein